MFRCLLICFTCLSAPLAADETWDSDMGLIIYEAEENGAAIFSQGYVDWLALIFIECDSSPTTKTNFDWLKFASSKCEKTVRWGRLALTVKWGKSKSAGET